MRSRSIGRDHGNKFTEEDHSDHSSGPHEEPTKKPLLNISFPSSPFYACHAGLTDNRPILICLIWSTTLTRKLLMQSRAEKWKKKKEPRQTDRWTEKGRTDCQTDWRMDRQTDGRPTDRTHFQHFFFLNFKGKALERGWRTNLSNPEVKGSNLTEFKFSLAHGESQI